MHVDDIEEALAGDDIRAIEGAFRALVDFPHQEEIEGAETVEVLASLLGRVTWALQLDQSVMPAATCQVIAGVMAEPISTAATYAHGATIVMQHHDHWRELFLNHRSGRTEPRPRPRGDGPRLSHPLQGGL